MEKGDGDAGSSEQAGERKDAQQHRVADLWWVLGEAQTREKEGRDAFNAEDAARHAVRTLRCC